MNRTSFNPEKTSAQNHSPRFGKPVTGERRVVTILFCDVTGSTSMAEHLDPEEWAEIMNEAFQYLITPVHRYDGTVANLMGDSILAFFGAPTAHEDDPQRAILAGLSILEGIQPFCERIKQEYGLDFHVRVGINTGPVVVGQIGADQVMEYTALGDAVNIAARMEQTATPGTVQVAEDTFKLVKPLFDFEFLGQIEVKGKSQPVKSYQALSAKVEPGRLRGIEGLYSPIVGRDIEFELLKQALVSLSQGRGGIIFLLGEAGLGKSRLIEEMKREWLLLSPDDRSWNESRSVSYDSDKPYSLLIEHMRDFLGVKPEDSPIVVKEKIGAYSGNWDAQQREAVTQALELLLSVHEDTEFSSQIAETLKFELTESHLNIWRETASCQPTVFVLDDLHWADSSSIELLGQLFQLTDELPLLIVCAMRPYRKSPAWDLTQIGVRDYTHRYTQIELSPLENNDSHKLIDNLLTVADFPDEVRHIILEKGEGNPLFVEEVIRTLIDDEIITRDESGTHWKSTTRIEDIELPENLEALLISRIDRLDQDVRRTLQLASVIGRTFFYRILDYISDAVDNLQAHLNTLQRVELIREAARLPELEYLFRHELTRDAAYHTILRRQRKEFHKRVGEAIELLFTDQIEAEAHILGKHFRESGDKEKAACYFTMAGDRGASLFANKEALKYYQEVLRMLDKETAGSEQLISLYKKLGRVLELSGQFHQALELYQEIETLGEMRGDKAMVLAGLVARTTLYATPTAVSNPELAHSLGEQAVMMASELDDPRQEAKSFWNLLLAHSYMSVETLPDAIKDGEQALEIARHHGFKEELGFIKNDLARAYIENGQHDQGMALAEEARTNFKSANNLPLLVDNLAMSADGLLRAGDLNQALTLAKEAAEVAMHAGSAWAVSYSLWTLAIIHGELGEWWRSVESTTKAIEWVVQAQISTDMIAMVRAYRGLMFALMGDLNLAFSEVEYITGGYQMISPAYQSALYNLKREEHNVRVSLKPIIEDFKGVFNLPSPIAEMMLFFVGDAALGVGEYAWLLEYSSEVLNLLKRSNSLFLRPDIMRFKALSMIHLGREDEGCALLEEALRTADTMGSLRALIFILFAQLERARSAGDNQGAAKLVEKGRSIIEIILEDLPTEELRQMFMNTSLAEKFLKNHQKI